MAWPKGKPRKAPTPQPVQEQEVTHETIEPEAPMVPHDWQKGALLNVRNNGDAYHITLYPEEFDYLKPERCLRFTNPAECQNFVSKWYTREHVDPRAR